MKLLTALLKAVTYPTLHVSRIAWTTATHWIPADSIASVHRYPVQASYLDLS